MLKTSMELLCQSNDRVNYLFRMYFRHILTHFVLIDAVRSFIFLDIGADILDLSGATIEGENIKEEAVRSYFINQCVQI